MTVLFNDMQVLENNKNNYENLYAKEEAFLRYPADWIIRFYNMYLKTHMPAGAKVLDYGCGSGNNAVFFAQKNFDVYGVDVAPSFKSLVKKNYQSHNLAETLVDNFTLISPESVQLDYPDEHFDFIFSNQVLYYLPNVDHLHKVCLELKRVLKPGGTVFFTMMGPKNYYITKHLKSVYNHQVFQIKIDEESHRLFGVEENILLVRDEEHLESMFNMFDKVSIGYFDQSMFDMKSNFHYIFVGKK